MCPELGQWNKESKQGGKGKHLIMKDPQNNKCIYAEKYQIFSILQLEKRSK